MMKPREKAGKYNAGNPPPSLEAARERSGIAESTIQQIEARLEFSDSGDFADGGEYRSWVGRTISALGYWRAERNFLNEWIRRKVSQVPNLDDDKLGSGHNVASENFEERVANALAYAKERYKPEYSATNPPPSTSKARRKMQAIKHFMNRMESVTGGLRDAAKELNISDAEYSRLTGELGQLIRSAQVEFALIRSIRDSVRSPEMAFLLSLVERAVAGGMAISGEERVRLDEVRRIPVLDKKPSAENTT
jgi:hypothetical protein